MKTKFAILVFALVSFFATAQTTNREMTDGEKIAFATYSAHIEMCKQVTRNHALFIDGNDSFAGIQATLTTKDAVIKYAQKMIASAGVVDNPVVPVDGATIGWIFINASKGALFDLPGTLQEALNAPADPAVIYAEWLDEGAYNTYDQAYLKLKGSETKMKSGAN